MVTGWYALVVAGLFEVVWAVGLKYTDGFTKFWPSLLTLAGMGVSFWFLSNSLKTIPMGTAYTVWTAIGAVGTVLYGICFLKEPVTILRVLCISMIIAAVIGLKLSASSHGG